MNNSVQLPQINKLRDHFQQLSIDEKQDHLKSLDKDELKFYYKNPDIFLFEKQIIPDDGEWIYYLLRCGRGFGKSHAGAAWVAKKIRQGAKKIGLCGPTYSDVEDTMVPMILDWFLPEDFADPKHPYTNYKIKFKSGAVIYCYSSEIEKKGPNLDYLWLDEIATWCQGQPDKIMLRFEDTVRAVRKSKHPRIVITSTPKNHPFFTWFQEHLDGYDKYFKMVQGSMFDNPTLSDVYKQSQIDLYGHNSRGRQELFGDLITETPGAYWTHEKIDECREALPAPLVKGPQRNQPLTNDQLMGRAPIIHIDKSKPYLIRALGGFDPSGSTDGDECGIIFASLYSNQHAYVIEDCSGNYDPATYAKLLSDKYREYDLAGIVVESNFGGRETFKYVLRSVNATMNVITVHSKQGKTTRAEHISSLYAQGKVHHIKVFKQLEDQMCRFNVNYSKSPDRLDALGFVLTELFFPSNAGGGINIRNLPSY